MLRIRGMTIADVPFGMYLKAQAGWNQTEADWQRFLDMEPDGCFLAEMDGEPAGTLTTCVFGSVAWIAMVLVEEARRGQGIATALLKHAIAYLDNRGVPTVRLDATALGRPVYTKLGFADEYGLTRYGGTPAPVPELGPVQPYTPDNLEAVAWLDRQIAGVDRSKLLSRLLAEEPELARIVNARGIFSGYCALRPGTLATQVGPCLASSQSAGQRLLADALTRCAGKPVMVDVPVANEAATSFIQGTGLAAQRSFVRMYRGIPPVDEVSGIWASSGPEKG
jgi:GNAT superfamily N-acetyltransferase